MYGFTTKHNFSRVDIRVFYWLCYSVLFLTAFKSEFGRSRIELIWWNKILINAKMSITAILLIHWDVMSSRHFSALTISLLFKFRVLKKCLCQTNSQVFQTAHWMWYILWCGVQGVSFTTEAFDSHVYVHGASEKKNVARRYLVEERERDHAFRDSRSNEP